MVFILNEQIIKNRTSKLILMGKGACSESNNAKIVIAIFFDAKRLQLFVEIYLSLNKGARG